GSPSDSARKRFGGSQCLMGATAFMPGPKLVITFVGLPLASFSMVVGMNQEETPSAVAMACHTCSGEPGTSTSASTYLLPSSSFFTGIGVSCAGSVRFGQRVGYQREAVGPAARCGLIVVLGNEMMDGFGQLPAERRALAGRAEPDHRVDGQR